MFTCQTRQKAQIPTQAVFNERAVKEALEPNVLLVPDGCSYQTASPGSVAAQGPDLSLKPVHRHPRQLLGAKL